MIESFISDCVSLMRPEPSVPWISGGAERAIGYVEHQIPTSRISEVRPGEILRLGKISRTASSTSWYTLEHLQGWASGSLTRFTPYGTLVRNTEYPVVKSRIAYSYDLADL